MSFDLRIWEQQGAEALPTSLDDAARAMLTLESRRPGSNPKFVALARALVEK
jgi:hypothetical protein